MLIRKIRLEDQKTSLKYNDRSSYNTMNTITKLTDSSHNKNNMDLTRCMLTGVRSDSKISTQKLYELTRMQTEIDYSKLSKEILESGVSLLVPCKNKKFSITDNEGCEVEYLMFGPISVKHVKNLYGIIHDRMFIERGFLLRGNYLGILEHTFFNWDDSSLILTDRGVFIVSSDGFSETLSSTLVIFANKDSTDSYYELMSRRSEKITTTVSKITQKSYKSSRVNPTFQHNNDMVPIESEIEELKYLIGCCDVYGYSSDDLEISSRILSDMANQNTFMHKVLSILQNEYHVKYVENIDDDDF